MNLLLLGYAIPCLRLLLRAMGRPRYARWRRRVNYPIGCLEWAIQSVRDSLGLVAWTAWLGYAAWLSAVPRLGLAAQAAPPAWPSLAIGAAAVGLSLAARRMKRAHRVRLLAYAARFPRIQPGEYFQAFFAGFGPLPLALPDDPPLRTLPTLDFRRGKKARLRVWPVLHGAFSTSFIARQMFLARRVHGPAGAMPSLDGLMQIWGARMMLLGRLRVIVEGIERAAQIRGQCVLCFNHKSALDFAVALAVLGLIDFPHRPPWRIRFLAARDHFLDNWFFYRGIGIGRAIEIAGMIFVNRRGTPEERRQAIADAVEQLVRAGVDLAIYPQGTRAPGRRDANGERMDAGYFTAGGARRLATIGGHVRKGAAHLAVLAAKRLAKEPLPKPLYVVPIALLGTATALPKGSVRVQTATEIRVVIGEPRRIAMDGDPNALINAVHAGIDGQLEQGLGLRAQLATRCLRDIHRFLSADVVETVAGLLRRWSAAGAAPAGDAGGGLGDDRLVFAILDLIYTHPPARWQPWLRRLAESLHQGEPREVLEALYREVIQGL